MQTPLVIMAAQGLRGKVSPEEFDEYNKPLSATGEVQTQEAIPLVGPPKAAMMKSARDTTPMKPGERRMVDKSSPVGSVSAAENTGPLGFKDKGLVNMDNLQGLDIGADIQRNKMTEVSGGGVRRQDFATDAAFESAVARDDEQAPIGSGSSLRKAPRRLGTLSGDMRRAGRAAQRAGATSAANQLFGAAAMQGLKEPGILSQEQRGRIAAKQQESQDLAQQNLAFQKRYFDYANRVMDKRMADLDKGGIRTMEQRF